MNIGIFFRVSLCAISIHGAGLHAQDKLGVELAIDLALAHDPRIDEKQAFVRQAQGLLAEAEGSGGLRYGLNAFVGLAPGVDGGFYDDGETSCSANCEPRDDRDDLDDGLSLWGGMTFSIIKPLATFGRLEHYQAAARHNITVHQQAVSLQRDQVALQVVRAYYGYLTARDSRLLLEDNRERLESALALVMGWLDEGDGNASQSDRYALEAGIGLIDNFLAEASALETVAMAGLKLLTGRDDEFLELADSRLRPLDLPTESEQQWIELAIANRPEFRQVEAGLAARRALVQAKRSEEKPIVYAGVAGSLAYSPGRDSLENPYIHDVFNHAAASPLLGLRWTWEQGAQPARVQQAQAELDALVHRATFAREGIPFQVREQYQTMQAKYRSITALRESSKAARRWMIAAYSDFEAGLEEAEKIIAALQVYVTAYAQYLSTVNDFNNQVSKLRSVSGVFQ